MDMPQHFLRTPEQQAESAASTQSEASYQRRECEIREQVIRWMSVEDEPMTQGMTIPASPDDVLWLLDELQRLRTRGGIARSLIPVAQVEKFHRRCKELGV